MIIGQYNPLMFYANKLSRQFENTENVTRIVTYEMYLDTVLKCVVPKFSVLIDSTDSDPAPTFSMVVNNCAGTQVFTSSDYSSTNKGLYTQITFAGGVVANSVKGYYEIVVTINSVPYYSDFFQWTDDLTKKLKITTESTMIRLGSMEYEMANTAHEFYIDLKPETSGTYLSEEANETYAITNTNYASSAVLRSFKALINEPIFIFLRALRILSCNGEVTFNYRYIDYSAKDIVVEIESDHGNADLIDTKIEFKVLNESVSVFN